MKFNIRKAMEYYQNLYNNYERQFPIHKNTVINHASSQEEQEDLKHYYNLCDHIEKQIIIHQNEMIQKVSMQKEMITHMKYGVGGLNLYRGYYNPSPILDLVVGNCSRGRLTKKYNVNVDDYTVFGAIIGLSSTVDPLDFPYIVKEKWRVEVTDQDSALHVEVIEGGEYIVDPIRCSVKRLMRDVHIDEKEFDHQYQCRKKVMKIWFLFSAVLCFILLGCGVITSYVTTIVFSLLLLIVFGTVFGISLFSLSKRRSDLLKRQKSELHK